MFDFQRIEEILKDEPKYRIKQVKQSLFVDLIDDWAGATTLPAKLRERLGAEALLKIEAEVKESKDKHTAKALITLDDGLKIETVLMRHEDKRHTVCVSSQVGCPLGCLFCATGRLGFKRNLSAGEIAGQVLFFSRRLKQAGERVSNVVFMGMGEPFLNYENVMAGIKILRDPEGMNLGARRLSISTAGIVDGIKKFTAEDTEINLAISLHAAINEKRSQLMPVNKKYPLAKVMAAVSDYVKKTRRRVMFEYLMIDGVNDTDEDARALVELMDKPLYFVNLIRFNPTGNFKPSKAERLKVFKEMLQKNKIDVTQRWSYGQDIDAACGQLAAKSKC